MLSVNIQSARASIRSAKFRTFLTTIGVIVGVLFFVLISTVADGFSAGVRNEINSFGANLIAVTPGQSVIRNDEGEIESFNFAASFGASTLTEKDLRSLQELEEVESAAPQMIVSGVIERSDNQLSNGFIMATNSSYPQALNQNVETGNFFSEDAGTTKVAVVGSGVVEDLFAGTASIGSSITIRGISFTIVGIMEEFNSGGLGGFGPDINKAVFIPFDTGKEFNGGTALIQEIDLQLAEDVDTDAAVAAVNETLLENHGGEEDFSVIKQDEIIDITDNVFSLVKNFSNLLSIIIMVIGGIVILLVMLITVKERTREIGIRKAIGATDSNILWQFIIESIAITWFGFMVGSLMAVALGLLINLTSDLTPVYTLNTFLVAFGLATMFGLFGGVVPSFIAARKDPVEALRNQ